MQFSLRYDGRKTERKIRGFLDGVSELIDKSGSLTFSRVAAGRIGVLLFVLDDLVEELAKHDKSEGVGELFADYFYAKALLYAYADRVDDGRQYWAKAHGKRVNARFAELCQRYYH